MTLTLDTSLHIAEILALVGGARGVFRAAMALRDGLRDLRAATIDIRGDVDDHEDRLRMMEGKPLRRSTDNRRPGPVLPLI